MAIELRSVQDGNGNWYLEAQRDTGTQLQRYKLLPYANPSHNAWVANFLAGDEDGLTFNSTDNTSFFPS